MNLHFRPLAATGAVLLSANALPGFAAALETSVRHGEPLAIATGAFPEQATKPKTGTKVRYDHVILKGYDPVAYFKQGRAVKGNPAISSTYRGATYLFVSRADKADFDRNPARFEPQYGGFCANSMAKGKKKAIDPNAFHIHRGKLYVCESAAGLNEFRKNPDANVAKADRNWLKIGQEGYNTETMDFERPWPFGPESD